jgi:hypothetical protein
MEMAIDSWNWMIYKELCLYSGAFSINQLGGNLVLIFIPAYVIGLFITLQGKLEPLSTWSAFTAANFTIVR